MAKKVDEGRKCPISKEEFTKHARPLSIQIAGAPQAAMPKHFSTGSFGWYLTGKATVEVNGIPIAVQIGLNLTVIGSKEPSRGK